MITSSSFKSRLLQGILATSLLGGMASSAFAIALGDAGAGKNGSSSYSYGSGGEFYFKIGSPTVGPALTNTQYNAAFRDVGSNDPSFQTFCLEQNEAVANGNVKYVVNNGAVNGGTGGAVNNKDIISLGTAWLYSLFAQGTLSNYDHSGSGRDNDAGRLQNAIWALEDEDPAFGVGQNYYWDLAVGQFGGSAANAKANAAAGDYGVWVLNNTALEDGKWVKKQDMLYYAGQPTTTTGTPVPDGGASLAMLGLSLAGLSLAARFHRKSPAV